MEDNIKILIVDDEPLARERIRLLLDGKPEIKIIGESSNGHQAVESIIKLHPDLVFLDIQMPEFNGFDVIQVIGVEQMPVVIFVTAYDQYAVKAFDVHAIDYLLKPFDRDRLDEALQRAKREIGLRQSTEGSKNIQSLLSDLQKDKRLQNRILVKTAGRITILRTDQIDWVESAGNYIKLHVGGKAHLLRETMKGLSEKLDSDNFVRIHRTTIVNMERIKELQPHFHGDYAVILEDGTKLTLSRRYRNQLRGMLGDL
jgi:two-component system LytT family response regulator